MTKLGGSTNGVTMANTVCRTICWTPIWNKDREGVGLEHLLLTEFVSDSIVLAFDEEHGPFRLTYRLTWDESWRLRDANLVATTDRSTKSLSLRTDGQGQWQDGDGQPNAELDGCVDVDIWPTPFTNSFPIRREPMVVGERRQFRMAWISAPNLTIHPQLQAYTRLSDRLYLFENLNGSGFTAQLPVDEDGIVLDYPGLFRRVIDSR
ncbi:putative glycolipid-binding domain-containing protein [Leptolyngbya sp. FACHB-36]|uniref:putative glycolipid-binding domain-containing protein n=1 Tax=Leptolyngbya sp. FACHB-36 TaxID=2692808 RepID=UPI001F558941|nr:putative glycolipid-binding domain-containing protein [Leptolyngbya sp. FACHB-36]